MCLRDYVQHNGQHYYISSVLTINGKYETMVFPCTEDGVVTDWCGVHKEHHADADAMTKRHTEIVADIGSVIERG